MQDTCHFTDESDRLTGSRQIILALKRASILILVLISMKTEEFFAHLMEWARICALID